MLKVLERIVRDQTMKCLAEHNLLYKFQSGFRKNNSTDFCPPCLTDKISKGFNSGLLTDVMLIELQKKFDSIDHNQGFGRKKNENRDDLCLRSIVFSFESRCL